MNYSIAGVMSFNMFGIPFVGPDTCGFFGRSGEDEMCARWIQLATFYPFARQHHDDTGGGAPNEPWRLREPFQSWARNAIHDRLQYLRHLYTCLFEASKSGQTCFDPLFFHYPYDDSTFMETEHSFIVGDALKVSPVLAPGVKTIRSYFPRGSWVSMKDFGDIVTPNASLQGEWLHLKAPTDTVNVHLRPGFLVPFQDNRDQRFNGTEDLLTRAPLALIANRDEHGHAQGKLFLDRGYSVSELEYGDYEYYEFQLSANSLKKWVLNE